MKLKIVLNSILMFVFLLTNILKAQEGEVCWTNENTNLGDELNIPPKTPGERVFLRALFVYVVFSDDNFTGVPDLTIWQKPTNEIPVPIPTNPYPGTNGKLLCDEVGDKSGNFMDRYTDYTITDFFCEMSMGQLDLIGDEVYVRLPQPSTYYKGPPACGQACLNRIVLDYLNSTQTIDWRKYNNWTEINGEWVFQEESGEDGEAELIVITYRTIPNNENGWFWPPSVGGEGSLAIEPITFRNDGIETTVGPYNGVTCLNMALPLGRSELLMEHEISHKLLGLYNPGFDDGRHTSVGMMTNGHANTTFFMTPMERASENVEYMPYPDIVNTTGEYELEDFIETGDVLRIPLPGTNDAYYWIVNHQKKSKYDGLSRGGKICYDINFGEIDPECPEGKGIFVYSQDISCNNLNTPTDIVSAEGRYSWTFDRTLTIPPQNYMYFLTGGTYPLHKTLTGDRIHGVDEYRKSIFASNNQLMTNDACSMDGGFFISWNDRGDGLDAFNMGYDEIFSPYSNPPTRTCANTENIALTIKLVSQNSETGAITLKVYYGDNDFWDAISECPPAKPKNVKTEKIYFGGAGSASFHPKITWDANTEPDFESETFYNGFATPVYEIWRANNNDCNAPLTYTLLTTVANNVTEYTDNSVTLHDPNHDSGLEPCDIYQTTFSYKIAAIDNREMSSLKSERASAIGYIINCNKEGYDRMETGNSLLEKYSIGNYPNPFNPVTNIKYSLPKEGFVSIKIYDVVGRMIKELVSEFKEVGNYSVVFDGSQFASGIYFYKIETPDFVQTKRMVLIK